MCRDCGCSEANHASSSRHDHKHEHDHEHLIDGKWVKHSHAPSRRITLELSVLAKNDRIAKENRNWFEANRIRVMNLISSPGSGKTMLLEKTTQFFNRERPDYKVAILVGDQEQDFDARRLQSAGADVLQLNTQSSCHLDAAMIQKKLGSFVRPEHRLLIIENVGNLVCPAAFDLGEGMKVALLSTAEGEDKPSKYPLLFREAGLIVITKMDLAPYLDWNLELCERHIRKVNTTAPILHLSSKTGSGLDAWFDFVSSKM